MRKSVELAINVTVTGVSTLVGADTGGLIGTEVGALVPAFATEWVKRAQARVAAVAQGSADGAGFDAERFATWIADDPEHAALLKEALDAAWETLDPKKLDALTQALSNALADQVSVDVSRLLVRAIDLLDEAHIVVLRYLAQPPRPERAGWQPNEIADEFPGLGVAVQPILATLDQSGCLVAVSGYGGSNGRQASPFGREVLALVAAP